MVSILPSQKNFSVMKNTLNTLSFGKISEPPHNFTVISDNFLYRGGALSKEIENKDPIKQLRFLLAKKVKSILCFLNPEEYRYLLEEELFILSEHNKNNPHEKIRLEFLPCWLSKQEFNAQRGKIKTGFAEKIQELPKPIYMHCLAGNHVSEDMEFIFKEAVQEGKIKL